MSEENLAGGAVDTSANIRAICRHGQKGVGVSSPQRVGGGREECAMRYRVSVDSSVNVASLQQGMAETRVSAGAFVRVVLSSMGGREGVKGLFEARVDGGLRVPVEGTSGQGLRSFGAARPAWTVRAWVEGLWRRFRVAGRRGGSRWSRRPCRRCRPLRALRFRGPVRLRGQRL